MKKEADLSGFILTGGKSSRMGVDKALLKFRGGTFLSHALSVVQPYCSEVFICGSRPEYGHFGCPLIADIYDDIGPISGIYSGLTHSKSEWNLFLSVDTPFVDASLIQFLISNSGDFDCIVPGHENGLEPLAGLYHRRSLEKIEAMIQQRDFRLTRVIANLNSLVVNCNELIRSNPRLFFNVNREEDYLSIE